MYRSKSTAARGGNRSSGILNALHATSIVDPRANLPAEILVAILDYLPVADQIRFARASWRFQEMVYDDTRWVARLKAMGCWNELEARQRFEDMARKRKEAALRAKAGAAPGEAKTNGTRQVSATLFDVAEEEEESKKRAASGLQDGFQTMTIGTTSAPVRNASDDPSKYLDVFKNVKSIRGGARQEYGKIYGALAPFYYDLITAQTHADPIVFEAFRDPESQAQMLANLKRFAKSDWAEASLDRDEKIQHMMSIFESAVLREFEQGYEFWDVDGRMRRYANVLHILDGSRSGIELFIHKHPIFEDKALMVSPVNCMSRENPDEISLEPSQQFLDLILAKLNDQTPILERIFPQPSIAFWALADKIRDDIIMEYTTPLFDEAHERSIAAYLKAVSGVFEQTLQFFQSLQLPNDSELDLKEKAKELALSVFEPHVDLYLQEELDFFTKQAESEVDAWEKKLSEQDSSLESFYMANFNRSADKKDFLSSFKKVVMMPVTVLPNIGSTFANNSSSSKPTAVTANGTSVGTPQPSRPQTPGFGGLDGKTGLPEDAPKDELAAKAALMATKLEGIKSLFSIEVALNLVHSAKTSLGRAAVFIQLGGQVGEEAREQCANIFVVLLRILGQGHVKGGFQRAVESLSHYNPREASSHEKQGVAPLVMFIELVNVGDLISQMVDVFYEQQLASPKIADKNDFLDPAGLAKKKFEQMLDENVAAGLNKGIDALMDEVEYLQATMQLPTDYNPGYDASESSTGILGSGAPNPFAAAAAPAPQAASASFNIGPTPTAQRIVELVSSHTRMLTGTTEKSMLDVFNAEVGLRLFTAICKHLKRQRISIDGAVPLIADMTIYFEYVRSLRNPDILPYFRALRELSQIYLIDPSHAKDMATVIADGDRFSGVFRAEEVYEYAQRRADWYQVRRSVERAMYGLECTVM